MKFLRAYAGVSIVIGLVQVVDGVLLLTGEPRVANWYFALAESFWTLVSLAAFIVALVSRRAWWLPASYLLYVVSAAIYALYSFVAVRPVTLVTPLGALAGLLFGAYFAIASAWSVRRENR